MKILLSLALLITAPVYAGKRKPLPQKDKAAVIKVLQANELLHAAFFDYSGKSVEENAQKTLKALMKLSKSSVIKEFVDPYKVLKNIKAKNTRELNNTLYASISKGFVKVVNTYDVGPDYNSYSCSMVKKKWVQNSSKKKRTHNPYAPEMPHCGSRDTDHK